MTTVRTIHGQDSDTGLLLPVDIRPMVACASRTRLRCVASERREMPELNATVGMI